jgi:hypothetical protein
MKNVELDRNVITIDTEIKSVKNECENTGIKKKNYKPRKKYSYTNDIKPEDRFGRLVVKYYDNKKYVWFCQCDCGGSSFISSNRLIKGVHSCKLCKRITFKIVEPLEKYNNLTTILYDKTKSLWLCKCGCGNTTYVRSNQLAKGKIKSCGCLFRGPRMNKRRPENYTLKTTLLRAYKAGAKSREKEFSISEEIFVKLISDNCYYCGSIPLSANKRFLKYDKKFRYNGIDRVDNKKGYIEGNCVTCCDVCNKAKSEMSVDEFKNWIKRVYDRQFTK